MNDGVTAIIYEFNLLSNKFWELYVMDLQTLRLGKYCCCGYGGLLSWSETRIPCMVRA